MELKKKHFIILIFPLFVFGCLHHSDSGGEVEDIKKVLDEQLEAWNHGDIDSFMQGYWHSDSLMFVGSSITYGWENTLARYKKSYPDKEAMGTLKFTILKIQFISGRMSAMVTGRFQLARENDQPSGIFTILFKKINGDWKIVYDHTSSE